MATQFSYASLIPQYSSSRIHHRFPQKPIILRCSSSMKNNSESDPTTNTNTNTNTSSSLSSNQDSEPQNLLLKMAWYSSELLGIAASLIRPQKNALVESPVTSPELPLNDSGLIDRAIITETIRQDFQRSYFVTGNLTLDAYEEKCEFADPAGSFKGLGRFKRNCTNFGSLIEKSNMKLMKWEDFEEKSIGHWRFSCTLSFPWKPILSATGYTEYYFDDKSGKVCRHVEHWNVPKMTLLKQILRPSRRSSQKKADA